MGGLPDPRQRGRARGHRQGDQAARYRAGGSGPRRRRPDGPPGDPVDIANAAVFLVSGMATMITGHTLAVDGGFLSAGPYDPGRFAPPDGQKRSAYRDLDPAG